MSTPLSVLPSTSMLPAGMAPSCSRVKATLEPSSLDHLQQGALRQRGQLGQAQVVQQLRHFAPGGVAGGVPRGERTTRADDAGKQPVELGLLDVRSVSGIGVRKHAGRPTRVGLLEDAGGEIVGGTDHHGDDLRPPDLEIGSEVGGVGALGDVVERADRDVFRGIEGVGTRRRGHVDERADLGAGDRQLEGLHDHLGELLTDDRIARTEIAVRVAADDAPSGQVTNGAGVGIGRRDVGELAGSAAVGLNRKGRNRNREDQ